MQLALASIANNLPLALDVLYSAWCDTCQGSASVPPAVQAMGLGPNIPSGTLRLEWMMHKNTYAKYKILYWPPGQIEEYQESSDPPVATFTHPQFDCIFSKLTKVDTRLKKNKFHTMLNECTQG